MVGVKPLEGGMGSAESMIYFLFSLISEHLMYTSLVQISPSKVNIQGHILN